MVGASAEGRISIETKIIIPKSKDVNVENLREIFSVEEIDLNFYSNFKQYLLSYE